MTYDALTDPNNFLINGKLSVQKDGIGVGGVSFDNGLFTSDGAGNFTITSVILSLLKGALSSIAAPTGAAQVIATAPTFLVSRNAPAGACTSAVLQAGTQNGQIVIVTNESTVVANTITFNTAVATGFVLTDATPDAVVIKAASVAAFIWLTSLNSGNGAWVHCGPFAG